MDKVLWHTMMSLDGFIAGPNDDMAWVFGVEGGARATCRPREAYDLGVASARGDSDVVRRPQVLISDDSGTEHVAKLSVSTDVHPVIRAEAVAIELARRCGLDVPNARVISSLGRDVLLIERFDRLPKGQRRHVVSGLTMLGFDALLGARYGSYPEMLDVLREHGRLPTKVGRTLFERVSSTSRSATTMTTRATTPRSGTGSRSRSRPPSI